VAHADAQAIQRRMRWVCSVAGVALGPPDVAARTRVVAGRLDADAEVVQEALQRVRAGEAGSGTAPSTLAAEALYAVGPWTQAVVGEAAGCTPVAMRRCRERVA